MTFLDSISFPPWHYVNYQRHSGSQRLNPWYPHYFNTRSNLDYIGPIAGIEQYGVDQISESERKEFMEWYDTQKDMVFNNRHELKQYCQDDVTVLSGVPDIS